MDCGMKKSSKRIICLLILVALAALLVGCNKEGDLFSQIPEFKQENAIEIKSDLSIVATLVDSFSEDRYRHDELLKTLHDEAAVFNDENGADSLVAEKVDMQDGLVNLVMKFSGREAYVNYYNAAFFEEPAVFFVGTVEDALNNGLKLEKDLIDISDTSKKLDNEGLAAMKDAFIIIMNEHGEKGPLTVTTFGKVLYVTDGIERWYGERSVRVAGFGSELVYVVFR